MDLSGSGKLISFRQCLKAPTLVKAKKRRAEKPDSGKEPTPLPMGEELTSAQTVATAKLEEPPSPKEGGGGAAYDRRRRPRPGRT